MFAFFGLGAQEILLLACMGVLPVIGVVVFLLIRRSAKPRTHDNEEEDA